MSSKKIVIPVTLTLAVLGILVLVLGLTALIGMPMGAWHFWPEEASSVEVVRAPNGDKVIHMECSGQVGSFGRIFYSSQPSQQSYNYNLNTEEWTAIDSENMKSQLAKCYLQYTGNHAPCKEYQNDPTRP